MEGSDGTKAMLINMVARLRGERRRPRRQCVEEESRGDGFESVGDDGAAEQSYCVLWGLLDVCGPTMVAGPFPCDLWACSVSAARCSPIGWVRLLLQLVDYGLVFGCWGILALGYQISVSVSHFLCNRWQGSSWVFCPAPLPFAGCALLSSFSPGYLLAGRVV
ncbi:hypothetical protein U1Q18_006144 [Sarracenia purpurea var. burkii]